MNNFHNFEKVQESDTEADLAIPIKKKKDGKFQKSGRFRKVQKDYVFFKINSNEKIYTVPEI